MSLYDNGILMTNGFSIASQKPADLKFLAESIADRDNYVTNNLAYEGMLVFVSDTKKTYQYIDNNWKEFGFNQEEFEGNIHDGLDSDSSTLALSARQGKVLNEKLTTHTTDNTKHITAEERQQWNAKASTAVATQTENGLMSATDKKNLDDAVTKIEQLIEKVTTLENNQASMLAKLKTAVFWGNE